ncbi:MAG: alpha/beta fold hydrolase [Bdellovibrionia bacterium]
MMLLNTFVKSSNAQEWIKAFVPETSTVASTPSSVVASAGGMRLLKFEPLGMVRRAALWIIPSFINDYFILDLLPENSWIRHLCEQGHTVYVLDWGEPQNCEKHLTIESFYTLYLDYFLKVILLQQPQPIHLVGHCLGGTLALIAAQLYRESILSLTLLTAPIDFSQREHRLHQWAQYSTLSTDLMREAEDDISWVLLQSSFLLLKPEQIFSKLKLGLSTLQNLHSKRSLRFWALESWSSQNRNMRSQFYYFLIEKLYRQNCLVKGNLSIRGQKISLRSHSHPVFVVKASEDHIVDSTSHLQKNQLNETVQFAELESIGGHIGALIGTHGRQELWPHLDYWLRQYES